MSRVRISSTVDGERLAACRRLAGKPDSKLLDDALASLLEVLEGRDEIEALDRQPYDEDPDLNWEAPPGPALAYDGEVPREVLDLAAARRRRRS